MKKAMWISIALIVSESVAFPVAVSISFVPHINDCVQLDPYHPPNCDSGMAIGFFIILFPVIVAPLIFVSVKEEPE